MRDRLHVSSKASTDLQVRLRGSLPKLPDDGRMTLFILAIMVLLTHASVSTGLLTNLTNQSTLPITPMAIPVLVRVGTPR